MSDFDILNKNRNLKNRHAGNRCFLIGNGPSIAGQDLLLLKNDVKICFNSFHKHPRCKDIAPDYWMTADPEIWKKKDQFLMPLLEAVESNQILTKLFFPLWGKMTINGSQFLDLHHFRYDNSKSRLEEEINFCEGIPPFGQNVMLVGLMLAFYMGCNPIIMIGADHTWWSWTRESYAGKETPHFFKNDYSPISERYSFDVLQATIHVQRHQYLQLKGYAAERGYAIYNATPGGELDLFPRIDYDLLFTGSDDAIPNGGVLDTLPRLPEKLGQAALQLIGDRQYAPALVLVDEALRQNINRHEKTTGLDYLRSLCLLGLGQNQSALRAAHQDFIFNPANRDRSGRLLEAMGAKCPTIH